MNESLDDEIHAAYAGSSTASSSIVAELRRRESSSQRDDVEAISVADPFRPRLLDEDLADIKPDNPEDVSFQVEVILMPFGVAGPAPHVVDSLGPTRADSASIEDVLRFCDAPPSLEFRVPLASERPQTTLEGFICVYEMFLLNAAYLFRFRGSF